MLHDKVVQIGELNGGGSYVTINGFKIKNSKLANVYVQNNVGVNISGNLVYNDNLIYVPNYGTPNAGGIEQGYGISLSGEARDSIVELNEVFNTAVGIRAAGSIDSIVAWNHVHDNHLECSSFISNVDVYNDCIGEQNRVQCISFGTGTTGGIIENNLVHHCDDAGIIGRASVTGRVFAYNIVYLIDYTNNGGNGYCMRRYRESGVISNIQDIMHHNILFGCSLGIEIEDDTDSSGKGVDAYNNIAYKNKGYGLTVSSTNMFSVVKNNAIFSNSQVLPSKEDIHYSADNARVDYNYYGTSTSAGNLNGITTSLAAPLNQFMNLDLLAFNPGETPAVLMPLSDGTYLGDAKGAIDYTRSVMLQTFGLKTGSALIEKGIDDGHIYPDFFGYQPIGLPDIGAFEYSPVPCQAQEICIGDISIKSTPTGAKIYLDGLYKGNTNRNLTSLAAKQYILSLTKLGYVNYSASAYVYDGQISYVNAALQKDVGKIIIKSTPKASIYLNERYKGLTNRTLLNIASRVYTLKLNKTGYDDYISEINVEFNKTTYVDAILPVSS